LRKASWYLNHGPPKAFLHANSGSSTDRTFRTDHGGIDLRTARQNAEKRYDA
jgi:hypothetical protein